MTNEELNKRIHEILGMCWHDWVIDINAIKEAYVCRECHISKIIGGADCKDFTTSWEGFGILYTWWQKHEKFEVFFSKILFDGIASGKRTISQIVAELLSPLALTHATVKFFKEEQK